MSVVNVEANAIGKTMQEVLRGFTYKRGWTFKLEPPAFDHEGVWVVRITWVCEDSRNPGKDTNVVRAVPLPRQLWMGEGPHKQLEEMLRRQIHECETHEADEWMLFNGVRKFNPHAKEGAT